MLENGRLERLATTENTEEWLHYDGEPGMASSLLLAGFSQIPGVGEATAQAIIDDRNMGNIQNWDDLLKVKGIGPKSLEKIIAFAESGDPFAVHRAEQVVAEITRLARTHKLAVPVPDITSADLLAPRQQQEADHLGRADPGPGIPRPDRGRAGPDG